MMIYTYALALIPGILTCFFLLFLFIKPLERGFLGPLDYKKSKYIAQVMTKWPMYILLPLLFFSSGASFFMLPNVSFQKALAMNQQFIELDFPLIKENLMWSILVAILIVSLTRIVAFVYHAFLIRAILYSQLLIVGFFFTIFFINPRFHTFFVDNVLRPNWQEGLLFIIIGGTIAAFIVEGLVMGFESQLGFHTGGDLVPGGVYVCRHCLQNQFIRHDKDVLSSCTQCQEEHFRREK